MVSCFSLLCPHINPHIGTIQTHGDLPYELTDSNKNRTLFFQNIKFPIKEKKYLIHFLFVHKSTKFKREVIAISLFRFCKWQLWQHLQKFVSGEGLGPGWAPGWACSCCTWVSSLSPCRSSEHRSQPELSTGKSALNSESASELELVAPAQVINVDLRKPSALAETAL